jgi:hypothetical protein
MLQILKQVQNDTKYWFCKAFFNRVYLVFYLLGLDGTAALGLLIDNSKNYWFRLQ